MLQRNSYMLSCKHLTTKPSRAVCWEMKVFPRVVLKRRITRLYMLTFIHTLGPLLHVKSVDTATFSMFCFVSKCVAGTSACGTSRVLRDLILKFCIQIFPHAFGRKCINTQTKTNHGCCTVQIYSTLGRDNSNKNFKQTALVKWETHYNNKSKSLATESNTQHHHSLGCRSGS